MRDELLSILSFVSRLPTDQNASPEQCGAVAVAQDILEQGYFSFRAKPEDTPYTYGGEYEENDIFIAEYGIDFGDVCVSFLTPEQMNELGRSIINHLILNGHSSKFQDKYCRENGQILVKDETDNE